MKKFVVGRAFLPEKLPSFSSLLPSPSEFILSVSVSRKIGKDLELCQKIAWLVVEKGDEIKQLLDTVKEISNSKDKDVYYFRLPFKSPLGNQFLEGFINVEHSEFYVVITSVKMDRFQQPSEAAVLRRRAV